MFSLTVEYALRAVTYLSRFPDTPLRTAEIAENTRIPVAYLTKVLQGLQKEGIVKLQRGIGGGVSMAIPADRLTLLKIVSCIDPIKRIPSCPLELKSHDKQLCSLHSRLDDTLKHTEDAMRNVTIADLINDKIVPFALCDPKLSYDIAVDCEPQLTAWQEVNSPTEPSIEESIDNCVEPRMEHRIESSPETA